MFRPVKSLRYSLNLHQWTIVIKAEDEEEGRGYETYKGYVNSAPVVRNPKLFYTEKEFKEELQFYRDLLKSVEPRTLKIG